MDSPRISLIAAISEKNRAIGLNNQLLWHLPNDLKRFKQLTLNHTVIMGYKTYLSIGRPLPKRTNIVLSEKMVPGIEGILLCQSLHEALAKARSIESVKPDGEIFIIGGGQVYRQTIDLADRLYLTVIKSERDGDTFFPDYSLFTQKISEECSLVSDPPYCFVILEKASR